MELTEDHQRRALASQRPTMKVIEGIYGSKRLVIHMYREDTFSFVAEEFIELVEELTLWEKAAFVELPVEVHSKPLVIPLLLEQGFEFHCYQPDMAIMVWKGGKGKHLVPPAVNAHVGVGEYIFAQNTKSVLLIYEQRSRINRLTQQPETYEVWKPITGSLNYGEMPIDSLIREAQEEIGLRLPFHSVTELFTSSCRSSQGFCDTCIYYSVIFKEQPQLGHLQAEEGILEARWVQCKDIFNMTVSDNTKRAVRLVSDTNPELLE